MKQIRSSAKKRILFALSAALALWMLSELYLNSNHMTAPVNLRWATRREENTVGYLIYRAENSAGPFRQITRELIPAKNDPYLGGTYIFTDTDTLAGVTYYYELEDISVDGHRTRQEPISITARSSSPTIFGWSVLDQPGLVLIVVIATIVLIGSIKIVFA